MQCKKVKLRSCKWPPVFQKKIQFCVGEDLAFMIVDLTFRGQWPYHGQWHVFQVRYQPPCSSRLACLTATPVVHMGRFGHLFLGKSGGNSTGLCLRENEQ